MNIPTNILLGKEIPWGDSYECVDQVDYILTTVKEKVNKTQKQT